MKKQGSILVALFLLSLMSLYGGGNKIDKMETSSLESWQETMDISNKNGKYNVLITARDIAGNDGFVGPFNLFIDPDSDLPVVQISSPARNSRITSDINVVGICLDDDGVDYVELQIDDGETLHRVEGKEFWSFFIDTRTLDEGMHTLTAYGVDINGVRSKPAVTTFNLDRRAPDTNVENLGIGQIVSGVIWVEGLVEDGNGVSRLSYSVDGGETFSSVGLKHQRKTNQSKFAIKLDTRGLEDGPQVCWFKSVDSQGTEGIYTFLIYVDNTGPEVTIQYPEPEQSVASVFSLAGIADDGVGLKSLEWKYGRETGAFELSPGNRYWVQEFDLSASRVQSAEIQIIATDIAGNVSVTTQEVMINRELDKPQLKMIPVAEQVKRDEPLFIGGSVSDRVGAGEIRWSLDGKAEESISAEGGLFSFVLTDLPAGRHQLFVRPVNIKGVSGTGEQIEFVVLDEKATIAFADGSHVARGVANGKYVKVELTCPVGLNSLFYSVDGGEAQAAALNGGEQYTSISIPMAFAEGVSTAAIVVTATDVAGNETSTNLLVQRLETGEYERKVVWVDSDKAADNSVFLTEKTVLEGVYQGPFPITDVVSASTGVRTEFTGNYIKVYAAEEGRHDVTLQITDELGEVYESQPISITADMSTPQITVEGGESGYVKTEVRLSGSVSDAAGIADSFFKVGTNGNPQRLRSSFSETIQLSTADDGPVVVCFVAEDKHGRKGYAFHLVSKDSSAPIVRRVLPGSGDQVNGSILAAFEVADERPVVLAEYKAAGSKEWESFPVTSLPNVFIGTSDRPIGDDMRFRFSDAAGNTAVVSSYDFSIDNSKDAPVIEIHLPAENAVITEDFSLSGVAYDDDAIEKVFYRIDDGEWKNIEATSSFAISIPLGEIPDNNHVIEMYAEDMYGVKSAVVRRNVRVSLNLPEAEILTPEIEAAIKNVVVISGTAKDANGIERVEISVDNGNTYNAASGTDTWSYDLNTHIIDDGTHVIFVRVYDTCGQINTFSSLMNVDNTPPILQFEYPLAGATLDDRLFVSGQMYDSISLEKAVARINPLGKGSVPENLKETDLGTDVLVAKVLNISDLSEGVYNLEIVGSDKAKNLTTISKNFTVLHNKDRDRIEILYPLNGERVSSEFNIYGRAVSSKPVTGVALYVDGTEIETVELNRMGYFTFKMNSEKLLDGNWSLQVKGVAEGSRLLTSNAVNVEYHHGGPWVTIDNFGMGDFASDRPYLHGRSGYTLSEDEKTRLKEGTMSSEEREGLDWKKVEQVEISFNNGKSFEAVKMRKNGDWKYRLETGSMAEGHHFMLVRARMYNKQTAITRMIVLVDKTAPHVVLISPGEGGKYNGEMVFSGLSMDDTGLESVSISLRKGDKAQYGIPKFVQGLHFEAGFWGGTLWNVGFGLNFFDNNVKVQFHYGQFLDSQWRFFYPNGAKKRYGGHVGTIKILANIFEIPFGYYAGPDWEWLYMSGALGANFSLFSETQSGRPQVLAAFLAQLEFPRVRLKSQKYFSSFAFFTEFQLWFVPTDVNSTGSQGSLIKSLIPHAHFGIRVDVF